MPCVSIIYQVISRLKLEKINRRCIIWHITKKEIQIDDGRDGDKTSKSVLRTVHITIPEEFLKLVDEKVEAEVNVPEEAMDLGNGAELIITEGHTYQLIKRTYEINVPNLESPQLLDGQKSKTKKKD